MPIPLLQAHLVMLSRLEAEESLLEAERLGVGTGLLKPAPRGEVIAAWRRAARVDVVKRPRDREQHRSLLATAGIGVRVVKRTPPRE